MHEFPDELILRILTEASNLRARHVCVAFNRCNPDVQRDIWNISRSQAGAPVARDKASAFFDVPMKNGSARFLPKDLICEEMALINAFPNIIGPEKLRIFVQLCNPPHLGTIARALTPEKIVAMAVASLRKLRTRTDYFLYCILQEIQHPARDAPRIGKTAFESDWPERYWNHYKLLACNAAIIERYLDEMIRLGVSKDMKGLQVVQTLLEHQFGHQLVNNLHGYIYKICFQNGIETKGHRFFGRDALFDNNALKIPIELKVQAIAEFKDRLLDSFLDTARSTS